MSKTFKQLESENLVRCLTPGKRKNRVYDLTDKGVKVLKQMGSGKKLKKSVLEAELINALDESQIPYSRHLTLEGRLFEESPDFVILRKGDPVYALETRIFPPDSVRPYRLRRIAFMARDLKEGTNAVEMVLLLAGGITRDHPKASLIMKIVTDDYLDVAFFQDEIRDLVDRLKNAEY
ncbi:hypothetical protein AKJ64_01405 [candidate division MSBL1 archaeon SCGC-AAA259E17]|uniref:Uncharacterized protein n=1 Tax=candidate division MSBL1 archaeon SCGC-AAA259E17 TaxID=1698263 RepID=A0A133UFW0_9EURY|nr:hypothetical protein AKJ64_01405 [candidate division MSBL1 archaeon SCGC-AAA259E17]